MDFNDSFARRVSLARCYIYYLNTVFHSLFSYFDLLSKDENVNVVVVDTNFTEVFVYFISFVFNYLTYIIIRS